MLWLKLENIGYFPGFWILGSFFESLAGNAVIFYIFKFLEFYAVA